MTQHFLQLSQRVNFLLRNLYSFIVVDVPNRLPNPHQKTPNWSYHYRNLLRSSTKHYPMGLVGIFAKNLVEEKTEILFHWAALHHQS
jgi:hypothetical protein